MKKIIAICFLIIAIGGAIWGGISWYKYQKKLYNTVILNTANIDLIKSFINENFPDQVKAFDLKNAGALPANPPIPATK